MENTLSPGFFLQEGKTRYVSDEVLEVIGAIPIEYLKQGNSVILLSQHQAATPVLYIYKSTSQSSEVGVTWLMLSVNLLTYDCTVVIFKLSSPCPVHSDQRQPCLSSFLIYFELLVAVFICLKESWGKTCLAISQRKALSVVSASNSRLEIGWCGEWVANAYIHNLDLLRRSNARYIIYVYHA